MCIAIIKPKNVDFPTEKQFENCFYTNPHGAGFMYSDGEYLIIKKGFMTFEDFYEAFQKENISKDKLVFFHFRIATHGLIDGGNTHPFPITQDINILRTTDLKYKGFGLIHNGVFHFPISEFLQYDKTDVISDTMLLALKINNGLIEENTDNEVSIADAIAYQLQNLSTENKLLTEAINDAVGYNKVAVMDEKENYVKYGDWIEDKGVFYSNEDYDYNPIQYNNHYGLTNYTSDDYCVLCGNLLEHDKWHETTIGNCCSGCCTLYKFHKCKNCEMLILDGDDEDGYCYECADQFITNKCDCCGEKTDKFFKVDDMYVCHDCYEFLLNKYCK